MPKQVIVIMDDHYPFGECQESTTQGTRILVRKIYEVSIQQRNKLIEKASLLRKLKSQQLIKIQSVLQEEQTIHFLFQYVPIRLQTWISNINDQFIENFRDQLIKFSSYLANNFIKIDFRLKNIGMDHNYGAKYFLDPTFIYDATLNKQRLKSQYIRDITNLFKPYIQSNNITDYSQQPDKPQVQHQNQNQGAPKLQTQTVCQTKNKNSAISPPTYGEETQTTNKTKEKLQKYYQQMNASMDVQNQKILQQFMNVLDDDQEVEEPNHQNHNQRQNQQYQQSHHYAEETSVPQYQQNYQNYGKQISQDKFYNKRSDQHQDRLHVQHNEFQQKGPQKNNIFTQQQQGQQYGQNVQLKAQQHVQQHGQQPVQQSQSHQYQQSYQQAQPSLSPLFTQQNSTPVSINMQKNLKPPTLQPTITQKTQIISNPIKSSKISHTQSIQSHTNKHQQEQIVWKDDDLQDRIRKAIQNSRSAIKRFKEIKQAQMV